MPPTRQFDRPGRAPTRPSLTRRAARRQRRLVGITNCFRCYLLGHTGRPITTWLAVSLLVALATACSFPRPPDVGDDAAPPAGCSRDQDCGSPTPFCVDTACAACRDSASCPATRPVCDLVSHDCRTCIKDSECDSGACDLAAGRCVDQAAILYASPSGGSTDPCTQTSPCSLRRASGLVNTGTPYIVLQPGRYSGGASLVGKKVTIAGNNATLYIVDSPLSLIGGSNSEITIRDINIEEHLSPDGQEAIAIIDLIASNITIENMKSNTSLLIAVLVSNDDQNSTLIVGHSSFTGPSVSAPQVIIDGCVFHDGCVLGDRCFFHNFFPGSSGAIQMTNSILIADSTDKTFRIGASFMTHLNSRIIHNTFVGGAGIDCSAGFGPVTFDSNIYYNVPTISTPSGCQYQYNLSIPDAGLAGIGNITGDPKFKDVANGDFHVQPGSAAIDAANPGDLFTGHDFDGAQRPQGGRSDIGAFEYVPTR